MTPDHYVNPMMDADAALVGILMKSGAIRIPERFDRDRRPMAQDSPQKGAT